jgi:hypothetical protein
MRHWTIQTLNRRGFDPSAHVPAPFPGQWPTRIAWTFQALCLGKQSVKESYIGKPNREQVARLMRFLRAYHVPKYRVFAVAWEFDRENFLLKSVAAGAEGAMVSANRLYDAYHPWQIRGQFLEHFLVPLYLKCIGNFPLYSTVPLLKREYVLKYKQFMLKECGLQLLSAAERRMQMAGEKHRKIWYDADLESFIHPGPEGEPF